MNAPSGKVAWSVRGFLLYALALPLVPALLIELDRGSVTDIATVSGALSAFVAAALLVRFGVRRQRRRAVSRYTRADTNNLTWLGCSAVALGCFVCQFFIIERSLAFSIAVALGGFAGAFFSYGSMWQRVRTEKTDGYTSNEIVDALREAEIKVQDIEAIYVQLPHGGIRRKLKRLTSNTHRLMGTIERDPKQLRPARKYLNVFLPGVRQVAQSYRKSLDTAPDPDFDQRFNELLDKTDRALNEYQTQRENKIAFDLDVQMAVLRQQLDHELKR
jgi:5-bromo-4-chloroindolyl phosphate hydrolysis protein